MHYTPLNNICRHITNCYNEIASIPQLTSAGTVFSSRNLCNSLLMLLFLKYFTTYAGIAVGHKQNTLTWSGRTTIAIGTAELEEYLSQHLLSIFSNFTYENISTVLRYPHKMITIPYPP